MADSFWVIDSEENLTDSCVRASESYSDINDSTAFDRGSDVVTQKQKKDDGNDYYQSCDSS